MVYFSPLSDNGPEEEYPDHFLHLLSFEGYIEIFGIRYPFGTSVALHLAVQQFKFLFEVTIMAVSKKSIIKSSTAKPNAIKASKSATASPAAPAGKMVTALRVARNVNLAKSTANLAKSSGKLAKVTLAKSTAF
jgi:hypothetical protein